MDINDNQQINTFMKGMNTDVSDAWMDSSQYRYAENLRLVTNTESNSGELRLVEGTKQYDTAGSWDDSLIKAMTHIRDIMIVISNDSCIWVKDINKDQSWTCIYEPKDQSEEETFGDYLSLVTRYETPTLIKLYIADGKHQLMYINIASGKKVVGIDNIVSDVTTQLKSLKVAISQNAGVIPPAKVQYVYRLYNLGGAATTLSPLSDILSLYKSLNKGYKNTDVSTNKSVAITIPLNNQGELLNYIQIYRISYQQIGFDPKVSLIYDNKIPETNTFIDSGYDLEETTMADLLSMIKLEFKPKIIESKNDYLFAANTDYTSSKIDQIFNDLDMTAPSTGGTYNRQMTENILEYNQDYWYQPGRVGEVAGGYGLNIAWEYDYRKFAIDIKNNKYKIESDGSLTPVDYQLPSFRHGEVYRFGAVLYDKNGNRSSVKWVADIMIPETYQTLHTYFSSAGDDNPTTIPVLASHYWQEKWGGKYFIMYQIGIKFYLTRNIFENEDIAAVEIVRMPRTVSDRITITQGIVGMPYRLYFRDRYESDNIPDGELLFNKSSYLCPVGVWASNRFYATSTESSGDDDRRNVLAETDNKYLMFASPEYAYQSDDVLNILEANSNQLYAVPQYESIILTSLGDGGLPEYGEIPRKYIKSDDPLLDHANLFEVRKLTGDLKKLNVGDYGTTWIDGDYWTWVWDRYISMFINSKISSPNQNNPSYPGLVYENFNKNYYGNLSTYHTIVNADVDNTDSSSRRRMTVTKIAFPEVPDSDSFLDEGGKATWDSSITVIDNDLFMHWSAPLLYNPNGGTDPGEDMTKDDGFNNEEHAWRFPVYYPIGSIGKCVVLKLEDGSEMDIKNSDELYLATVNIKKTTLPYGGENTILSGSYMSFGDILYNDGSGSGVLTTFNGDCYPGIFNYDASHAWYEGATPVGVRQAGFYSVPLESDIDLSATYGDLMVDSDSIYKYYHQDKAGAVNNNYIQSQDAYLYNTAYGSLPTAVMYSAVFTADIDSSLFDTRVHHSEVKTNGEHIDHWLEFKSDNFIDVDSRFGEITNMRLFKDTMLYWQNNATGILSVNDRVVINDTDENQIILGSGGVLNRYDYISTVYGMKKELYEAETQSNTTLYWWDGNNKEILGYSGGTELVPLTKIKSLSNYINKYDEVEHPSLSYDRKYNEIISSVVNNESLIYNEQVLLFTSIYTFMPIYRTTINNQLFLTDSKDIYEWNNQDDSSEAVLFKNNATPKVEYVVNKANIYPKVFDITVFGGRFYGNSSILGQNDNDLHSIAGEHTSAVLEPLTFKYRTPLKQYSEANGKDVVTNREYDFRLNIPRHNPRQETKDWGDRMRGKTMQCELSSSSNSTDFSLQYITTKYRVSWS